MKSVVRPIDLVKDKRIIETIPIKPVDILELEASVFGKKNYREVLKMGIRHSDQAMVGIVKGYGPVALGGVVPIKNGGIPWIVTVPDIKKCKKEFFWHSKKLLQKAKRKYGLLMNMVCDENVDAIQYLLHLGFKFKPEYHYRYDGHLFIRFEMR